MVDELRWAFTKLIIAILGAILGFFLPEGLKWLSISIYKPDLFEPEKWNPVLTTTIGLGFSLLVDASISSRKIARLTNEHIEQSIRVFLEDQLPPSINKSIQQSLILQLIPSPNIDIHSARCKAETVELIMRHLERCPSHLIEANRIILKEHLDNWSDTIHKFQSGRVVSLNAGISTEISKAYGKIHESYMLIERKPLNPYTDWTPEFLDWLQCLEIPKQYILFCPRSKLFSLCEEGGESQNQTGLDKLLSLTKLLSPYDVKVRFCEEEKVRPENKPLPEYFFEVFGRKVALSYKVPDGFGASGDLNDYKIDLLESNNHYTKIINSIDRFGIKIDENTIKYLTKEPK